MTPIASYRYCAYGLLALPLAMAALPLYVHIPAFYAIEVNVELRQLGWVLFSARLFDTMQDPVLGMYVDRIGQRSGGWLIFAAACFGLAFWGLWLPPASSPFALWWLAVMLALTYTAHSFINISYLAWGSSFGANDGHVLLSASLWREGSGLLGTIVASAVPAAILSNDRNNASDDIRLYCSAFIMLLAVSLYLLLHYAPERRQGNVVHTDWGFAVRSIRLNRLFQALLVPYFLNALSIAIPATLVVFFINDQLAAPKLASAFLVSYFVSAACGLPLWSVLAKRVGALSTWKMSMMLAVMAFCGSLLLGKGDTAAYFAVCVVAGATLGADLVLPAVLIAQATNNSEQKGVYFGVYTLLTKLSLACTGLTMPVLAYFGYAPGVKGCAALTALYAGVPCLLKITAMLLLRRHDVKAHS